MIQNLPTNGFAWEKVDNFSSEKVDKLVETDKKGHILEVDIKYPKELHKNHNKLSFFSREREHWKSGKASTRP